MALELTSIVSEASVVDTLRTAATNYNFGDLTVNASTIKGILVTKSTIMPPTEKTIAASSVYDGMNSICIVSPAIFSYQVVIDGVLR